MNRCGVMARSESAMGMGTFAVRILIFGFWSKLESLIRTNFAEFSRSFDLTGFRQIVGF
jgi:hypothetical protein